MTTDAAGPGGTGSGDEPGADRPRRALRTPTAVPLPGEGGSGPGPGPADADLLTTIRGRPTDTASTAAFATLYDRHHDAARALARQLARSPSDADDLVSAAFARLLEVLRGGGGPTEAFRAYLLTSLRHLAYDRSRAERRLDLTDEIDDVVGVDPERTVVQFADPAVAGLERSLAARAFATLPERWQAVLWHLEVEGDSPADIAPLFGLSANAVSALGYRAREGLRQAYLQEHLATDAPPRDRRHRETGEKLGAYTRGGLSRRDGARVEAHLRECEECRALAAELREVNSGMVRSAVAPVVLGAALVGYLAARTGTGDFLSVPGGPTTSELAVAGGGALGVLGAVAGVLRPDLLPPRSRVAVVAVGLVGLGAATFGSLGVPGGLDGPPVLGAPDGLIALPPPGLVLPPGPVGVGDGGGSTVGDSGAGSGTGSVGDGPGAGSAGSSGEGADGGTVDAGSAPGATSRPAAAGSSAATRVGATTGDTPGDLTPTGKGSGAAPGVGGRTAATSSDDVATATRPTATARTASTGSPAIALLSTSPTTAAGDAADDCAASAPLGDGGVGLLCAAPDTTTAGTPARSATAVREPALDVPLLWTPTGA